MINLVIAYVLKTRAAVLRVLTVVGVGQSPPGHEADGVGRQDGRRQADGLDVVVERQRRLELDERDVVVVSLRVLDVIVALVDERAPGHTQLFCVFRRRLNTNNHQQIVH